MIALVHNILPPYRVSLFNAMGRALGGDFRLLLVRENHPQRRKWTVPWDEVAFGHEVLRGWSFDHLGQHRDLSFGVGAELDRLDPDAVVVAGWDLTASWSALAWCARRDVPAIAWVESWRRSGRHRGTFSNGLRRRFLERCSAALVPGRQADEFVQDLVPGLPTVTMANSVDLAAHRTLADPEPGGRALFVGELSERKGVDVLIAGRHRVLDHFRSLAFAGTGPLAAELREVAGRDPRVEPVGFVEGDRMVELMASSSALMLPSRRDPWPLVPVEALVAGRPVLLGPGVGSAADLGQLGAGVVTMDDLSLATLAAAAGRLATERVPDEVRAGFTPDQSAAAFRRATEIALTR